MLLSLLVGCSPLTAYRNTLLVEPPAPPQSMGAPVGPGVVTVGAYTSVRDLSEFEDLDPEVGDAGVYVPTNALGAHARVGVGKLLELGGHVDYTAADWAYPSAVGVLDVPGHDPLLGLGAHVTLGERREHFGWGATVDATLLSMPYARYEYTGPAEYLEDGGWEAAGDGEEFYSLAESGTAHPIRIRATGAVTLPLGPVDLSPGVSFCPTFTNEGFTNDPSAVYQAGPLSVIPVLDAGVWLPGARIGVQTWFASNARVVSDGRDTGWGARIGIDWVPSAQPPSALIKPRTSTTPVATLMP